MMSPEEMPTEEASGTQASSSRVSLETFYEQYTINSAYKPHPLLQAPLVIGPSTCKQQKNTSSYKPLPPPPSPRINANEKNN